MTRRRRPFAAGSLYALACLAPAWLCGQEARSTVGPSVARPPAVDTVILRRQDIFSAQAAEGGFLPRVVNALHVTTRPWVIRQEVLLEAGDAWDSALAAETERNLRRRGLFRLVEVDSQRVEGRLAAVVRTVDAWSILPRLEAQVAADGTLTGALGGTETNLAGTGNLVRAWYVRDVDRDGTVLAAGVPRLGGSRLGLGATFQDLSDRTAGSWAGGLSFRALSDRWSVFADGIAFDGRVLSFRSESAAPPDTVRWQRRALIQRVDLAFAPAADPRGYVRVGLSGEVRREELFDRRLAVVDSARFVPDTVYGLVGAWAELRRADFVALRYFNGFTVEDQDLSRVAFLAARLAPGGWGYGRTGVGLRGHLATGVDVGASVDASRRAGHAGEYATGPRLLLKLLADAHGLFDGAGLDSGRVLLRGTAALKPGQRQATFLSVAGVLQKDPAPGEEIDLGFRAPPRLWHPHAFTGTRSLALTLEHRWYAWDGLLDIFGLGLAGFLDYGGAWFSDQEARLGGDLGGSLLVGWPLRATPILTELSLGWRFGGGIAASGRRRWAAALGTGLRF